jgi:hypothetical protein
LEDPEMYGQKDILKLPNKSEVDDDPPNSLDTQRVNTATLSNPIKLSQADLQQFVSDTIKSHVNKCGYYLPDHNQMSSIFLVNGGTDGGVACANFHSIFKISRTGDIKRIDSHQVKGVTIGSKWGVANNRKRHVIAIFYKFLLFGKNSSTHPPYQLEYYPNKVNYNSTNVNGGMQWIGNVNGYEILLLSGQALHISICTCTRMQNWKCFLRHFLLTQDGTLLLSVNMMKYVEQNHMIVILEVSGLLYVHSILKIPRFVLKYLVGRSLKIIVF